MKLTSNFLFVLIITNLFSYQTTNLFSMEQQRMLPTETRLLDQVERGIDPLTQIKIWSCAVAKLNQELTSASKSSQPLSEEKIREFNTRKNDLIVHLASIQHAYPSLFVGCPHILATITRLNTATRDQMSSEQLSALLKTLNALQGNLEPVLKDPNISPCLKNTAVAFSIIGGGLITLTGITYVVIQMINTIKGW